MLKKKVNQKYIRVFSILILVFLISLMNVVKVGSDVGSEDFLLNGLVSHWKFDETTGDAIDSTDSNDGTVHNMTRGITGKIDTAYFFDGDGDFIDKIDGIFDGQNNLTISMWINTTKSTYTYLIQQRDETTFGYNGEWVLQFDSNGKLNFFDYNNPQGGYGFPNNVFSDGSVNTGNWVHIAFTKSGTSGTYYINGVASGTTSASRDISYNISNDFAIGLDLRAYRQAGHTSSNFSGTMDDIRIWNRALNSTEISVLYNSITSCSPPATLTENYVFKCSDYCNQANNLDAGGYNVTFNGTGVHNLFGNISNYDSIIIMNGCNLTINSGAYIK